MSKIIKNESYYVVHGWMINNLNLKGLELSVFAMIYGFSQTNNQWFTGSRKYLADFTNSSVRRTQIVLNSLVEKGLIEKTIADKNRVYYRSVYDTNMVGTKFTDTSEESSHGEESSPLTGEESSHYGEESSPPYIYNIEYNLESNKIDSPSPQKKTQKEVKHKYGEYQHVKLTDAQYQKLISEYGETRITEYITKIDNWIQMKGKSPYKDFNIAIRNWLNRDNISKLGGMQNAEFDERFGKFA